MEIDYPIIHPVHALIALCENHRGLRPRPLVRDRVKALRPIARRYFTAEAQYGQSTADKDGETAEAVRDRVRWGIRKLLKDSAKPAYATLFHDYGIDLLPAIPDNAVITIDDEDAIGTMRDESAQHLAIRFGRPLWLVAVPPHEEFPLAPVVPRLAQGGVL